MPLVFAGLSGRANSLSETIASKDEIAISAVVMRNRPASANAIAITMHHHGQRQHALVGRRCTQESWQPLGAETPHERNHESPGCNHQKPLIESLGERRRTAAHCQPDAPA